MHRQSFLDWNIGPIILINRNSGDELDETQQMFFKQETAKLLDFLQSNEDFYFRTIDDVLAENAALKEENKRLHDIIDTDIADLKNSVQHNSDDIGYLSSSLVKVSSDVSNNNHLINNVNATGLYLLMRIF